MGSASKADGGVGVTHGRDAAFEKRTRAGVEAATRLTLVPAAPGLSDFSCFLWPQQQINETSAQPTARVLLQWGDKSSGKSAPPTRLPVATRDTLYYQTTS